MGPAQACYSQGLSCPARVFQNLLVGVEEQECFIGDEVQNNLERLNLDYPITQGTITNWDNMEKVSYSLWGRSPIAPRHCLSTEGRICCWGLVLLSLSIGTASGVLVRRLLPVLPPLLTGYATRTYGMAFGSLRSLVYKMI